MEKYNKFNLLRLSSFFISSCKTQNLSEIIDHSKNPNFTPQNNNNNEVKIEARNYPFSNSFSSTENYINTSTGNTISHRKTVDENTIFDDVSGERCPPVSPLFVKQGNKNKKLKNKGKIRHFKNNYYGMKNNNGFSSSNETDDKGDWFSSDDDMEYYDTQTMFSLRSLSFSSESDSITYQTRKKTHRKTKSLSFSCEYDNIINQTQKKSKSLSFSSESDNVTNQTLKKTQTHKRTKPLFFSFEHGNITNQTLKKTETRKKTKSKSPVFSVDTQNLDHQTQVQTQTQTREKNKPRRRKAGSRVREVGVVQLEGKVKDTFAIVKSSSDPYDDFRNSMVEMIIEKQMSCAKELEQLLECFICLNSCHHHRVIVEVFIEICNALFSHSS